MPHPENTPAFTVVRAMSTVAEKGERFFINLGPEDALKEQVVREEARRKIPSLEDCEARIAKQREEHGEDVWIRLSSRTTAEEAAQMCANLNARMQRLMNTPNIETPQDIDTLPRPS